MRDAFIARLEALAESDPRIFLITGDLGFGVLDGFEQRFPRQYLNAGVAEQNMTGLATGIASRAASSSHIRSRISRRFAASSNCATTRRITTRT